MALGVATALLVGLGGAILTACYEVPRPECGFFCGPSDTCPDGYTCADDHRCHRSDTPVYLDCGVIDAAVSSNTSGQPEPPLDGAPDGPP